MQPGGRVHHSWQDYAEFFCVVVCEQDVHY